MRYFTVTHRDVPWPIPSFATLIGAGEGVPEGCIDLMNEFPETKALHPSLSEFRQLFALRRLLERDNEQAMVGVSHYRRFAVTSPRIAQRVGHQQLIDPASFQLLDDELFLADGNSLIVPAYVVFNSAVITQYGANHITRDLLYFFALATDMGVINNAQAGMFLGQDGFIAVPTIGVFPAQWLIGALAALESVSEVFLANVFEEREGYNGRSLAFCCERLMALFVQGLLSGWPHAKYQAPALVISPDGTIANSTL